MTERYSVATGGDVWSLDEIDRLLELLLPINDEVQFERAKNAVANHTARGHRVNHHSKTDADFARRFLWGLAVRLRNYEGPGPLRTKRQGTFSLVEIMIVKWSQTTKSKEALEAQAAHGRPDAAYLARLLCRCEATVANAIRTYGPAKGRRGFFDK